MRELPSGTVTFLFTDIEASTRLLQDLRDAYPDALAKHRRALRYAFVRHGGVEVDSRGEESFFAFKRARDALAAAIDAQRAANDDRIRIRIGLHTGEPIVTEDGYVGIDVHRAARVAAAGHGGQILITQSTRDIVGAEGLRDLGEHRFTDLTGPERIYQLGDEDFPPLKSLNQTNLPVQPTPLIGRAHELEDVLALVRDHRVVTLTGPGGSGKTRLALHVAAELVQEFEDGIWFVDLAALRSDQLVLATIAATLAVQGELRMYLRSKRILLVLDNFEQIVSSAPEVGGLLQTAPDLKLLVTSRIPLRVRGEREYPLPPLSETDAVTLFTTYAQSVKPSFEADAHVPEICRRLDGLPLALELASARVKVLTPQQLLERLERRLPLLTGGPRDVPERQRTLRATIAWSHELLDEREALLFSRLGVFVSGCTLEAAEEICDADLDTVAALVDKNLVRVERDRVTMLETIREFALERLDAGSDGEELRDRHARYFLAVAERAESEWEGSHTAWMQRLAADYDNIRASLRWLQASGQLELELRFVGALWHFWAIRGFLAEGRGFAEDALIRAAGVDPGLRAKVLRVAAGLASFQGENERAEALGAERLAAARASGDKSSEVSSLNFLGTVAFSTGDLDRARSLFEQGLELNRDLDDPPARAVLLENLAGVAVCGGQFDRAKTLLDECLALFRAVKSEGGIAHSRLIEGQLALLEQRHEEAPAAFAESLRLFRALLHGAGVAVGLHGLAAVAVHKHDFETAATLLGAAEHLLEATEATEDSLDPLERQIHELVWAAVRRELDEERLTTAWAEGQTMTIDEAVEYAIANVAPPAGAVPKV